jgi:hypothetical protein
MCPSRRDLCRYGNNHSDAGSLTFAQGKPVESGAAASSSPFCSRMKMYASYRRASRPTARAHVINPSISFVHDGASP